MCSQLHIRVYGGIQGEGEHLYILLEIDLQRGFVAERESPPLPGLSAPYGSDKTEQSPCIDDRQAEYEYEDVCDAAMDLVCERSEEGGDEEC